MMVALALAPVLRRGCRMCSTIDNRREGAFDFDVDFSTDFVGAVYFFVVEHAICDDKRDYRDLLPEVASIKTIPSVERAEQGLANDSEQLTCDEPRPRFTATSRSQNNRRCESDETSDEDGKESEWLRIHHRTSNVQPVVVIYCFHPR